MEDIPPNWAVYLAELDKQYAEAFATLGLTAGRPMSLTCPRCSRRSWILQPRARYDYFRGAVALSCPTACGYYGPLASFTPTEATPGSEAAFDSTHQCIGCRCVFAVDGVVVRKPCCAIENPRQVMSDLLTQVLTTLAAGEQPRELLESLLGRVVSTFDGVMRRMAAIAIDNFAVHGQAFPAVHSFQSLQGARAKLLADPANWDMSAVAPDWGALIRAFQKRHLCTHTLGVVDQDYQTKTGDMTQPIGKRVSLSPGEVVLAAEGCVELVRSFFGHFLS
jgi:hypothetical protein